MTNREIKEDLKNIQCYYGMLELFSEASKIVPPKTVKEKLKKYNEAISCAPVKYYALYCALYIEHKTQKCVAAEWGYSEVHIRHLNAQLVEYFKEYFSKNGN